MSSTPPIDSGTDISSKQVLTFVLEDEHYGADIVNVREVLEYCEVTRVPRCPSFMAGVINLRGHVVPVIDLRAEFGLKEKQPDIETCIIIFEFEAADEQMTLMGCIVDAVHEVVEVSAPQMGAVPTLGNQIDPSFIEAMAKIDDQFVIILDISQVLSQDQISLLDTDTSLIADPTAPVAEAEATN